MNLLNAILVATGSALGAAVLVLLVIRSATRRGWERAARQCRSQLEERSGRLAKFDADVRQAEAIGLEHLRWTLKCASKCLADVEVARNGGNLEGLIDALIKFRDGLAYFDGYSAAMQLLAANRQDSPQRTEGETAK